MTGKFKFFPTDYPLITKFESFTENDEGGGRFYEKIGLSRQICKTEPHRTLLLSAMNLISIPFWKHLTRLFRRSILLYRLRVMTDCSEVCCDISKVGIPALTKYHSIGHFHYGQCWDVSQARVSYLVEHLPDVVCIRKKIH